jgi:hypothetical protein
MASFLAASGTVGDCREERMGEVTSAGCEAEARPMRSEEAWRDTVGCESPRRTRLMDVGE